MTTPQIGDRVAYQGGEVLTIAKLTRLRVDRGAGGFDSYMVAKLVTARGQVRVPAFDVRRLVAANPEAPAGVHWLTVPVAGAGFGV